MIDREAVDLDEFLFEGLQRLLIEMKLEHERAVGHTPAALQHGNRLVEDLLKGHCQPSTSPLGFQRTVQEL